MHACVVHYTTETTPFEVWEIESKPQIACQGDGSGPDSEYETGLVTALPASGGEGDWYVDGQHFIANSQTGFDTGNRPLAFGRLRHRSVRSLRGCCAGLCGQGNCLVPDG